MSPLLHVRLLIYSDETLPIVMRELGNVTPGAWMH